MSRKEEVARTGAAAGVAAPEKETPKEVGAARDGRTPSGRASRLSAAIVRILAAAEGSDEGRHVTVADLAPPRGVHGDGSTTDAASDTAASVEWSLRMMS